MTVDHGADAYPAVTGICHWCKEGLVNGAHEAGAPPGVIDWMTAGSEYGGDYGCGDHPLSNEEGVWSHQTREDVARIILAADAAGIS